MSPLAYRYIPSCILPSPTSCEFLAVTQTVQESTASPYYGNPTGVRYYVFTAPTGTTTPNPPLYSSDFSDSAGSLYYWMSSNAIDKNQNVGYTFNIGDGSSNYPSVYTQTIDDGGSPGTLTSVQAGSASITDPNTHSWGEYFSMSIDPSDDKTFWGVGEYFTTAEDACSSTLGFTDCYWTTKIFSCQKGGVGGYCP